MGVDENGVYAFLVIDNGFFEFGKLMEGTSTLVF